MGYTLTDEHDVPYYVYHTDREVCDEPGCVCLLPSSAQVAAQRRAKDRDVWLVTLGVAVIAGPVASAEARKETDRLVAKGCKPRLLKMMEDYT